MESATGEIKMPWSEVEIETEAYETCLPYLHHSTNKSVTCR